MKAPLLTIRAIRSIGVEVPMTYALGTSHHGLQVLYTIINNDPRSEEHTSELSHVAISYAVFCLEFRRIGRAHV